MTAPLPFITVVVPIRNEERFIEQTLAQIAGQAYPRSRLEVIVVDGQSTDRTREKVEHFSAGHPDLSLRLETNPKRLSSAARNLGVRLARGDYVIIVDGHVEIPTRELLSSAADAIARTGAEVLGRPQRLSPSDIDRTQQMIATVRASRLGHAAGSLIYSRDEGWAPPSSIAVMYSRKIFERFGYFDERFDAAEDLEFNTRIEAAGVSCYTSPKLEILYYPRQSLKALFRQMMRYGTGRARLMRKRREMPSLNTLAPPFAVAAGVTLTALAPFSTIALTALVTCVSLYVLLTSAVYFSSRELRQFSWPHVVATFAAIHGGVGTGFWRGLLGPFPK
jgi:succinoglycan biosynthesis protein ExoA